jgi:hypothetical protein
VLVTFAQSDGTVTATVTDEKTGTTLSATDYTANCDPAGAIDSMLFGALPVFDETLLDVPTFHKVKPYNTTLNGVELRGERVDRQTRPGIKTSKLTEGLATSAAAAGRKSGDAFYLKYRRVVHCCLAPSLQPDARERAG